MRFRSNGSTWTAEGDDGVEYLIRKIENANRFQLVIYDPSAANWTYILVSAERRVPLFTYAKCYDANPYSHDPESRAQRTSRLTDSIDHKSIESVGEYVHDPSKPIV